MSMQMMRRLAAGLLVALTFAIAAPTGAFALDLDTARAQGLVGERYDGLIGPVQGGGSEVPSVGDPHQLPAHGGIPPHRRAARRPRLRRTEAGGGKAGEQCRARHLRHDAVRIVATEIAGGMRGPFGRRSGLRAGVSAGDRIRRPSAAGQGG